MTTAIAVLWILAAALLMIAVACLIGHVLAQTTDPLDDIDDRTFESLPDLLLAPIPEPVPDPVHNVAPPPRPTVRLTVIAGRPISGNVIPLRRTRS